MLDLSFLMSDPDFSVTCTLRRFTVVGHDHGRPKFSVEESVMVAVIQPAGGRSVEAFEDSASGVTRESLEIYSMQKLNPPEDENRADQIMYRGQLWDVVSSTDWGDTGNFYRAVLERAGVEQ